MSENTQEYNDETIESHFSAHGLNAGITTKYSPEMIKQSIVMNSQIHDAFKHPYVEIINLQDAHVKKALIALGWTPPTESRDELYRNAVQENKELSEQNERFAQALAKMLEKTEALTAEIRALRRFTLGVN